MKQRALSMLLAAVLVCSVPVRAFAADPSVPAPSETTTLTENNTGTNTDPSEGAAQPTDTTPPTEAETQPTGTTPPTEAETRPTDTTPPTEAETQPTETVPQDTTPTVPETTEPPRFPTQLEIDTTHIYPGMDTAYEDGYAPTVSGNWAHIVLPLVPTGTIYQNEIKASVKPGGSPAFVPINYEKRISLEEYTQEAEPIQLFLVEFDIELSSSRTNGVYPLSIEISGFDENAQPINGSYPFYVTVTDSPIPEPPKMPGPVQPTAEPVLYISKTVIEPAEVMAGEDFTMTVTVKHSLPTKTARNILVTVNTGNLKINLLEDSNISQVKQLDAGKETELTFHFSSDASIAAGKYDISFSFAYDTWSALHLSSQDTSQVNIKQPMNMELVMPRFSQNVTVGETIPLNLQVMNMGRDRVHNVRCTVSGFGFAPSNTGYIGTMEAGSSASTKVDLYIVALNTSPGNENGEQYGDTVGTVTLIYEDEAGKEYQQTAEFDTTVKRPIVQLPQDNHEQEKREQANQTWWYVILILGGVILAAGIGMYIYKKHKKEIPV